MSIWPKVVDDWWFCWWWIIKDLDPLKSWFWELIRDDNSNQSQKSSFFIVSRLTHHYTSTRWLGSVLLHEKHTKWTKWTAANVLSAHKRLPFCVLSTIAVCKTQSPFGAFVIAIKPCRRNTRRAQRPRSKPIPKNLRVGQKNCQISSTRMPLRQSTRQNQRSISRKLARP